MTTVSDAFAAADGAAAARGRAPVPVDSAGGARTHDARDARARTRIPVTQSIAKRVTADLTGAWVWRDAPPPLSEILAGRNPSAGRVPAGSRPLRLVWLVWNFGVAIPATATLYVLAWVLQHPARAGVAALVTTPLLVWITTK